MTFNAIFTFYMYYIHVSFNKLN